jgi:hypothetical protein
MALLLEDIEPGTPVYLNDDLVGSVRGVYAEGAARLAEYLLVAWTDRNVEVLVPTKEVASLEAKGVILMGEDPEAYRVIPPFNEANYPTIRRLR